MDGSTTTTCCGAHSHCGTRTIMRNWVQNRVLLRKFSRNFTNFNESFRVKVMKFVIFIIFYEKTVNMTDSIYNKCIKYYNFII